MTTFRLPINRPDRARGVARVNFIFEKGKLKGWPVDNRECLDAFSKKFENHCHALALYFLWYN